MRHLILLPLALTLLAASLHGQTADFTAFDARLQEMMKEHRLPGLAAGIAQDHRLAWAKGYGFADQDREIAVTVTAPAGPAPRTPPPSPASSRSPVEP